jgi:hypothetical protein
MKAYQAEQAAKSAMLGNIMNAVGTIGGFALGGPIGSSLGGMLTSAATKKAGA